MKNQAAVSLGRLGGKSTSEAKRRAVRENGKLGGRPKKPKRASRLPNGMAAGGQGVPRMYGTRAAGTVLVYWPRC
jgi:hypothetical protein